MESRALGSSNAMIGPEHMFPKTRLKQVERNSSLMVGSEGMMITWVPILGKNYVLESAGNPINYRHHILAARSDDYARADARLDTSAQDFAATLDQLEQTARGLARL